MYEIMFNSFSGFSSKPIVLCRHCRTLMHTKTSQSDGAFLKSNLCFLRGIFLSGNLGLDCSFLNLWVSKGVQVRRGVGFCHSPSESCTTHTLSLTHPSRTQTPPALPSHAHSLKRSAVVMYVRRLPKPSPFLRSHLSLGVTFPLTGLALCDRCRRRL